MALRNQIMRRRLRRGSSWSTISGILTASVVTLIGASVGLEPDVILWRALTSGILMSLILTFGISVIYVANASQ